LDTLSAHLSATCLLSAAKPFVILKKFTKRVLYKELSSRCEFSRNQCSDSNVNVPIPTELTFAGKEWIFTHTVHIFLTIWAILCIKYFHGMLLCN
jgi:hypothetical protein